MSSTAAQCGSPQDSLVTCGTPQDFFGMLRIDPVLLVEGCERVEYRSREDSAEIDDQTFVFAHEPQRF
jgi:hypothetical protein